MFWMLPRLVTDPVDPTPHIYRGVVDDAIELLQPNPLNSLWYDDRSPSFTLSQPHTHRSVLQLLICLTCYHGILATLACHG